MRLSILLILALCLALAGCNNESASRPAIAVVDLGRLMRDSEPGKEGMKFIEAQQKEMQAQLDVIQDKLEKNPQDEASMQELQQLYNSSQQRIQAEGQNAASQIMDVVLRTLDSYRAKNGYEIIIYGDSLASYDNKLDVTEAVLKEINTQKITFKPLTSSSPAQKQETSSQQKEDAAPQSTLDSPKK